MFVEIFMFLKIEGKERTSALFIVYNFHETFFKFLKIEGRERTSTLFKCQVRFLRILHYYMYNRYKELQHIQIWIKDFNISSFQIEKLHYTLCNPTEHYVIMLRLDF